MSYKKAQPKVEGQDPIRPKYGIGVHPKTKNEDAELHTKRNAVGKGHRPAAKDSVSGK